jgi:hypothetical protein
MLLLCGTSRFWFSSQLTVGLFFGSSNQFPGLKMLTSKIPKK